MWRQKCPARGKCRNPLQLILMNTINETQNFRQNKFLLILISAILVAAFTSLIFQMTHLKESASDDFMGMTLSLVLLALVVLFLFNLKTSVTLKSNKLSFKSNPFSRSEREIPLANIKSWSIESHKWHQGLGYRRSLGKLKVYVMVPGSVLAIEDTAGYKYRFGINRPKMVKRYIDDHWSKEEVNHG